MIKQIKFGKLGEMEKVGLSPPPRASLIRHQTVVPKSQIKKHHAASSKQ